MNEVAVAAIDPQSVGVLLDMFPILFKFKFLLRETHKQLDETIQLANDFVMGRIRQAKVNQCNVSWLSRMSEGRAQFLKKRTSK